MSQEMLAEQLSLDRTTIIGWEQGATAPLPWHRPNLAMGPYANVPRVVEFRDRLRTTIARLN